MAGAPRRVASPVPSRLEGAPVRLGRPCEIPPAAAPPKPFQPAGAARRPGVMGPGSSGGLPPVAGGGGALGRWNPWPVPHPGCAGAVPAQAGGGGGLLPDMGPAPPGGGPGFLVAFLQSFLDGADPGATQAAPGVRWGTCWPASSASSPLLLLLRGAALHRVGAGGVPWG